MNYLTKEELIDKLDEIELYPEIQNDLDSHLSDHILNHDIKFIEMLLKAGANPNSKDDLNDYLRTLLERYKNEKRINGEEILSIMKILLEYGANPNRVSDNNLRAYDYAVSSNTEEVIELLQQFSAKKELRKPI